MSSNSSTSSPAATEPITAFFYGTLMVPQIFHRVCHSTESPSASLASKYTFTPALLRNFSRRKVLDCDFPAIIPQPGHTVLGSHVTGLTKQDVECLDRYEGSMYTLDPCEVQILPHDAFNQDGSPNQDVIAVAEKLQEENKGQLVKSRVYVWADPVSDLEEEEWCYVEFRREKMRRWVFGGVETDDFVAADVQRRISREQSEESENDSTSRKNSEGENGKVAENGGAGKGHADTPRKKSAMSLGGESESEELRTKRIVSVVAGIAAAEEAQNLSPEEIDVLASAV